MDGAVKPADRTFSGTQKFEQVLFTVLIRVHDVAAMAPVSFCMDCT
jgi:hypothetical protein